MEEIIKQFEKQFNKDSAYYKYLSTNEQNEIKQFLSQALADQKKEMVERIKGTRNIAINDKEYQAIEIFNKRIRKLS
uniref:NET domain-containing protein n=1 Tax=viral metagenome TaxID=1070528 RepID=A0A6H1ZFR5_9ZZZZ